MNNGTPGLAEWQLELEKDVQRWQIERTKVDVELQRAMKKLELVRQMRSLEENPAESISHDSQVPKESRATPASVREMAYKIISESDRPLHISEIHKEFLNKSYPIPGGGTPFNILAHLVNNKSFVRVARGTYALAGSVPQEQVLPRSERKVRRRRRKKKPVVRLRMDGE